MTRFIEVTRASSGKRDGAMLLNVAAIASVEPTELYKGGEGSYITAMPDGLFTVAEKYIDLVKILTKWQPPDK